MMMGGTRRAGIGGEALRISHKGTTGAGGRRRIHGKNREVPKGRKPEEAKVDRPANFVKKDVARHCRRMTLRPPEPIE